MNISALLSPKDELHGTIASQVPLEALAVAKEYVHSEPDDYRAILSQLQRHRSRCPKIGFHDDKLICKAPNCTNKAGTKGLCQKHGGKTICRAPGCRKQARIKGLCPSHGPTVSCKVPACTNRSVTRGLCTKHSRHKKCVYEGCTKSGKYRGYCISHAQTEALVKNVSPEEAISRDSDAVEEKVSKKGNTKLCIVENCQREGISKGRCSKHYQECHHPGCKKTGTYNHYCGEHAVPQPCQVKGCTNRAARRNTCRKHLSTWKP